MTQNKLKIAITGGIGSGKSTVASYIKELNYPVFSCDEIYKELCCDKGYIQLLEKEFGNIFTSAGELDKKKIAASVFSDKEKLKKLNEIAHPRIMQELLQRMKNYSISFAEVPLLFEEKYEGLFDKVIIVYRPLDKRIQSVMARDSATEEQVQARIKNQINYENLPINVHTVIRNDGDLSSLKRQVLIAIKKIMG